MGERLGDAEPTDLDRVQSSEQNLGSPQKVRTPDTQSPKVLFVKHHSCEDDNYDERNCNVFCASASSQDSSQGLSANKRKSLDQIPELSSHLLLVIEVNLQHWLRIRRFPPQFDAGGAEPGTNAGAYSGHVSAQCEPRGAAQSGADAARRSAARRGTAAGATGRGEHGGGRDATAHPACQPTRYNLSAETSTGVPWLHLCSLCTCELHFQTRENKQNWSPDTTWKLRCRPLARSLKGLSPRSRLFTSPLPDRRSVGPIPNRDTRDLSCSASQAATHVTFTLLKHMNVDKRSNTGSFSAHESECCLSNCSPLSCRKRHSMLNTTMQQHNTSKFLTSLEHAVVCQNLGDFGI